MDCDEVEVRLLGNERWFDRLQLLHQPLPNTADALHDGRRQGNSNTLFKMAGLDAGKMTTAGTQRSESPVKGYDFNMAANLRR